MERNQRIALALEIKNPDLSGKLGNPSFTAFLKEQAKLNPSHVASVEKVLSEIVLATQQVFSMVMFSSYLAFWVSFAG